jgi:hypothetical protein
MPPDFFSGLGVRPRATCATSVGGVNCGVGDVVACSVRARGVDLSELALRINDGRLDCAGRRSGVAAGFDTSA